MSSTPLYSADVVDALIRDLLETEPEAFAKFAHSDEQVRLRGLPGGAPTIDPLDGLDVMGRHIIAVAFALRSHRGAVSLASEQQARDAGWPSARVANVAIILGWALFTATEPAAALPVLLEPDEKAKRNPLLRLDAARAPIDKLLTTFHRWRRSRPDRADASDPVRSSARRVRERHLASPDMLLKDLLGIDAITVEIPADTWCPEPTSANARAVRVWVVIALEMLDLTRVMQSEGVVAVRLKTHVDARLAGLPDATAANLALLLAASLNHGSGYTVTFLPADDRLAMDLVEASRRIRQRSGEAGDLRVDVVDMLDVEDVARRGYIHVGRFAAERVAGRLLERN